MRPGPVAMRGTDRRRPRAMAWLWLVAALAITAQARGAGSYRTEHVFLVIIDGLRYSEGLGDPDHRFVPRMHDLALQGAVVDTFLNDRFTYTARGIPAIWCGAWSELRTVSSFGCGGGKLVSCELPTIFEYYRKQLGRPQEDCIVAQCEVDYVWRGSLDSLYGPEYWPLYRTGEASDAAVWENAKPLLIAHHPSFFLLYLERVDHFAHSGSWAYYTRAAGIADSLVGVVWDFIQSDSVYAGKTTLFVTNDHGRHTEDFTTHGDDCDGCRRVELLAVGPDIRQGLVSSTPRTICDIAPTIGELLGFKADRSTGSVMREILVTAAAAPPAQHPAQPPAQLPTQQESP
jgi:hypothetical protein